MQNKRLHSLNRELGLHDYKEAPRTQAVLEKVRARIYADTAERKIVMKRKLIGPVLAATLLLSALGLTVFAATTGWHQKLIEYFNHPTEKQMELMQGAFDTPMISGTDNGYTVNVLHTLADKHGIYVLYELILPSDKEVSEDTVDDFLMQINHMVLVEQKGYSNNDNAFLGGIGSHQILGVERNKIILCEYFGLAGEIASEYKVSLTVGNMRYVDTAAEFGDASENIRVSNKENAALVGDFHIHLTWNFKYEDKGRSITVNEKLDINGYNENTLVQVDVSPISVWIVAEGDAIPTAIRPVIRFTDGTEITYDSRDENAYAMFSSYLTGDYSKGYSTLGYVFAEITDVSTIESITIGDRVIPVS